MPKLIVALIIIKFSPSSCLPKYPSFELVLQANASLGIFFVFGKSIPSALSLIYSLFLAFFCSNMYAKEMTSEGISMH